MKIVAIDTPEYEKLAAAYYKATGHHPAPICNSEWHEYGGKGPLEWFIILVYRGIRTGEKMPDDYTGTFLWPEEDTTGQDEYIPEADRAALLAQCKWLYSEETVQTLGVALDRTHLWTRGVYERAKELMDAGVSETEFREKMYM